MESFEGLGVVLVVLVIVVLFVAMAVAASPMGLIALTDLLEWGLSAVLEGADA